MEKTVAIKLPKGNTIFQHKGENILYLYRGFSQDLNGHILISYDMEKGTKSYLMACHDEFKKKFAKIGEL